MSYLESPVVFNNILPQKTFETLSSWMVLGDWQLSNTADVESATKLSWELTNTTGVRPSEMIWYETGTIVKYKIKKFIKENLNFYRIHTNGQTFGMGSEYHTDYDEIGYFTVVVFTSPYWDTQWGGQFVCRDFKGNHWQVPYFPNNAVVIPAHWEHYGASPNVHTDKLRTSVALGYKVAR